MTSNNSPPESPKSSLTGEPRDPLEFAQALVERFSTLSPAVESGVRDRLMYDFLQGNFLLGTFYKECPDDYRRFASLEYWRNVRQKPNKRNVMRSVLAYTMRTKEPGREALKNRVYKYARVLEYFHRDDVISDEVPQRLKDGGGIDAIYARLCRDARPAEGRGVVGLEETIAELPLARTENGTVDDETSLSPTGEAQSRLADSELDGALSFSYDDGRQLAVEGRRRSVPLTAASDPTNSLSDDVQPAGGSKQGALDRINLKTILAVEMFEFMLQEVLHAKRATIRVIIEPRDQRGWVPVRALSVPTSNSAEGPWPGQSTIKRDAEERP